MTEIKELTDKYFVLKIDDVLRFGNDKEIEQFNKLSEKIARRRKEEDKGANSYLVLNLEDEISLANLSGKLKTILHKRMLVPLDEEWETAKVKDIAIDIVNAILRAKDITAIETARVTK